MADIYDAVEILKEYCSKHECEDCAFNRAEEGCYDCMLNDTSPCDWDVTEIRGEEDA